MIPCLTVPAEEEQAIGIWGQRHLDYLKQYRKVTYTNLLTSGRLNAYLADINRQAQERFERLIEGMKQAQGITEQLKAENALEWTGCLNNIRACARVRQVRVNPGIIAWARPTVCSAVRSGRPTEALSPVSR